MKISHISLFLILLFGTLTSFAQDANKWLRIEFENKKFSVAVPQTNIIDTKNREFNQQLRIVAFENGVEMEVHQRKSNFAADHIRDRKNSKKLNDESFTIGEFLILKPAPIISGSRSVRHSLTIIKGDVIYVLFTRSKTGEEKEVLRFLRSVRIEDQALFEQNEKTDLPEDSVSVSSLNTSPEIIEAEKRKTGKFKGKISYELQELNPENDSETEDLSHRALIIEQPRPRFSPGANITGSIRQFTVRLKVQFRADGQIGDIIVLSNADKNFTKSSIDLARRIKFVPARRDSEFVDSFQIVGYSVVSMPTSPMITIF